MTSKLEYLKKYQSGTATGGSKANKQSKNHSKKASSTFVVRDLSDELPVPKQDRKKTKVRELLVEEDVEVVDQEKVAQAQKVDAEISGVKWKISNHRPSAPRRGGGGGTAAAAAVAAAIGRSADVKLECQAIGNSDEDVSPPRAAPAKLARHDSDDDFSAPRAAAAPKARHDSDDDTAPPKASQAAAAKRTRHDSDDDVSPPRTAAVSSHNRARHDSDDDIAPPGKVAAAPPSRKRHDSDDDISPPRAAAAAPQRKRHDSDDDISPPRAVASAPNNRKRHDSDDDISPPRAKAAAPNNKKRHDSDDDISPPRAAPASSQNRKRHDSDDDISPPRAATSAPQKRPRHDSDNDISPPRAQIAFKKQSSAPKKSSTAKRGGNGDRHDSDDDISPPRALAKSSAGGGGRHDSDADMSPPRRSSPARMSSGLRAGLVAGTDLKKEAAVLRQKQREALEAAPAEETGKGAETVYRNKEGKEVTRQEWLESKKKNRKKKMSDYPEQELEWGGGVKQTMNKEEEKAELERIAAQPFARYEPDEKYQEELRNKQDWLDPMKKVIEEDEQCLASAASGQPKKKKPKCPHAPWPNRFNIVPGYRWDGKVRTNGYEQKLTQSKNDAACRKQEAYKMMELDPGG